MDERRKLDPAYRGSDRSGRLPCCAVDVEDLRRLYRALQAQNDTMFDGIMRNCKEGPNQTHDDVERNVRDNLRVTVVAIGQGGERRVTHDIAGLEEAHLPSVLVEVVLDTAWLARSVLQGENPSNWCYVRFDFRRPPLVDFSNASGSPTPNGSNYRIVADDAPWGATASEELHKELARRSLWRRWLHGAHTYDALTMLLGVPLALWGTWRVTTAVHFHDRLPGNALGILLAVYVFLSFLFLFRGAYGASRWLWPYVELRRERQSGLATSARVITGAIFLGVVSAFVYDLTRALLK